MTSSKDNLIFEKTSFLHGNNSPFIKELYLKYLNNPKSIPQSWMEFFDGLNEDQETIKKEILGPSWTPRKENNLKNELTETKESSISDNLLGEDNHIKEKEKMSSLSIGKEKPL